MKGIINYFNLNVKMNGFKNSSYQLMVGNYSPLIRNFVNATNNHILAKINDANVSKENYKNFLDNIISSTPQVQQNLSDLSDEEGVTLLQMVEYSIENESNPLKRKKLIVLKEFLDYQLGLSDTEDPPGSPLGSDSE
jgi:hypothetical protein